MDPRKPVAFQPTVADTVAEEWLAYRLDRVPLGADVAMVEEARAAFHAGGLASLVMILEMQQAAARLGSDQIPDALLDRYERWYRDLLTFSLARTRTEVNP